MFKFGTHMIARWSRIADLKMLQHCFKISGIPVEVTGQLACRVYKNIKRYDFSMVWKRTDFTVENFRCLDSEWAAEYTIGICKEKAKKPKVSKWLILSWSQCKHSFHHQCRKPSIFKSRLSLAVLRSGQSILLFQNSHGLTGILHSIISGFSGLVVRC